MYMMHIPCAACSNTAFGSYFNLYKSMPSCASGITTMASWPYLVVVVVAGWCWWVLFLFIDCSFVWFQTGRYHNWLFVCARTGVCVCVCVFSIKGFRGIQFHFYESWWLFKYKCKIYMIWDTKRRKGCFASTGALRTAMLTEVIPLPAPWIVVPAALIYTEAVNTLNMEGGGPAMNQDMIGSEMSMDFHGFSRFLDHEKHSGSHSGKNKDLEFPRTSNW